MTEREIRAHLEALSKLVISQHRETRSEIKRLHQRLDKQERAQNQKLTLVHGRLDALGNVVLLRNDGQALRAGCDCAGESKPNVAPVGNPRKRNSRVASAAG
jgi:hypothetical protein